MSRLPAVLVLSGGGFQGLAVVRLLAEADSFRIVVADTHDTGPTAPFVDRFVRVPPVAERSAFGSAIVAICRDEAVRLVLPSTDHELEALADAAPSLEGSGVTVAVCAAPLLARLRDKSVLYGDLDAAGLPVLLPVSARSARLPLIGKPRSGWGGRGVIVARTTAEVEALPPDERDALLWQPFLEGADEISADFALLRNGQVPGIGLRRRIRTSSGFAVVSDTVTDNEIEDWIRRFASWVAEQGGRGLFNVQLLRRGSVLVISDVNPRLGTSAVHWRGSGFNPVLALCAEAGIASGLAGAPRPSTRTRCIRHLEEVVASIDPMRAGVGGIVFDLDDTLIPTKRFMRDRLERSLETFLFGPERERAKREGVRILEEGPRDRLLDALADAMGWEADRRGELGRSYGSTWPDRCAPYSDVLPALDELRRRGLRLGLLTDNPPTTQRKKVEVAGLEPFFDAIVFARETGAEKPDGRGFARIAERLGLEPGRLAMAGDNPHRDLAGAAQAGFGRLFWVHRDGASASFDPALASELPGSDRFERVHGLRQMLALLGSAFVPVNRH